MASAKIQWEIHPEFGNSFSAFAARLIMNMHNSPAPTDKRPTGVSSWNWAAMAASTTKAEAPSSEWVPCRCPPLAFSIPTAITLDSGGSEWAMVLERWSQSHTKAVPAVVIAPMRIPVASSGYQPKAYGPVEAIAIHAAAPDAAWCPPIKLQPAVWVAGEAAKIA